MSSTKEHIQSTEQPGLPADRDAAIEQYMPLVKYVVRRLAVGLPGILDYEDLLSYGTIGLIEAIDRFDDTKGVRFESYAPQRIRGAIFDALRALDRLPRSVRQKARQRNQVIATLSSTLGREPSEAEVAREMGLTRAQYTKAVVASSWVTVSLDGLLNRDNENDSPNDVTADPDILDFSAGMERRQLLESLTGAIGLLPEREQHIVSLYYQDGMTMKEISQILEISESRVCQLHGRALGRLRDRINMDEAA